MHGYSHGLWCLGTVADVVDEGTELLALEGAVEATVPGQRRSPSPLHTWARRAQRTKGNSTSKITSRTLPHGRPRTGDHCECELVRLRRNCPSTQSNVVEGESLYIVVAFFVWKAEACRRIVTIIIIIIIIK